VNILTFQESKERARVNAMGTFAAATHWAWYFYYQFFFPEIYDLLATRILLCLYSATFVFLFSRGREKSISTLRFFFKLGLLMFLANEAVLVFLNPQQPLILFTFFGLGLITSSSVLRFKDFFIFAGITVAVPIAVSLVKASFEFEFLVHWTTFSSVVLFVIGYLVHSNFSYKNEIRLANSSSIQNAKMAALGEMASGMAHEINNPLTIIKSKSELLLAALNSAAPVEKEKIKSDLQKIKLTTDRIGTIIKSLKSFSRNSQNDPMVSVSLESIISSTLQLCGEKIKDEKIELQIEPTSSRSVLGKESEISQVLLNLIGNSIDALENQDLKKIEISFEQSSDWILIKVIDSGPPISENIKTKLMDPFFTTKDVGKGTGLGLSISKRIALSFGGDLYLLPNSKQTCFVLKLQNSSVQDQNAA
jgi:signal transduction histidine kinase